MKRAGTYYKMTVIIAHALVGWAYCGTLIAVGRRFLSMQTTLVLHAIGAPVGSALISHFYYRRFAYTNLAHTAAAFLEVVVGMDLLLVAPVFEKSYAMFSSVLGTWVPFALIFAATYLTGRYNSSGRPSGTAPSH